ncbi:unnamed protein product, partial [marine sediment metagenome]
MERFNAKIIFIFIIIFFSIYSCQNKSAKTLTIFHAGSLTLPLKLLSEQFIKANRDIIIYCEPSGSLAAIRKITELHKPCDLL